MAKLPDLETEKILVKPDEGVVERRKAFFDMAALAVKKRGVAEKKGKASGNEQI